MARRLILTASERKAEVIAKYSAGETNRNKLAIEYGVARSTIDRYLKGVSSSRSTTSAPNNSSAAVDSATAGISKLEGAKAFDDQKADVAKLAQLLRGVLPAAPQQDDVSDAQLVQIVITAVQGASAAIGQMQLALIGKDDPAETIKAIREDADAAQSGWEEMTYDDLCEIVDYHRDDDVRFAAFCHPNSPSSLEELEFYAESDPDKRIKELAAETLAERRS